MQKIRSQAIYVVILAVLAFMPVQATAKPGATWTEDSFKRTVVAGTSETVTVSFELAKGGEDISLWVTPAIRPFVSVTPELIADVSNGESVSIDIAISVPTTTTPMSVSGTVHVRNGKRTIAKPLPIELEVVWQSQDNSAGGFSVTYPKPYQSVNTETKTLISGSPLISDGDGPAEIELFRIPQPSSAVIDSVRVRYVDGQLAEESVFVDGIESLKISGLLRENSFGWGGNHHTFIVIPLPDFTTLQFRYDSGDSLNGEVADLVLQQLDIH